MSDIDRVEQPPCDSYKQVVTLLAPTPQDAKYCKEILNEQGILVEVANSTCDVAERIRSGGGVVLIAQEHLAQEAMDQVRMATTVQPSWSDIPILVLLTPGETPAREVEELLSLGNVTFMERPLRIALLVSTLRAKLRDRNRQYEVRDLLHQAQQASKSKSAIVANISHEIRTPMTSILGYAELMSSLVDNEEALNYLSTIRRNGDFLLGIINDILDLSKIEAEKLDIDFDYFDVSDVLNDVHSVMEIRANEKGLCLAVEYVGQIPESIRSDSKRLRQILINLVGNAIKFTASGCVTIKVSYTDSASAWQHTQPQPHAAQLRFAVIDSGIGMSREQQERLFQPFSQGDSLITQKFGGTGLGLAISKRLAEMLNGEIQVESKINKGSTFTLTIAPGEVKARNFKPLNAQKVSLSHATVADQKVAEQKLDAHVLIVDDRRDIRFLSSRIVVTAGGQVTEAEDGLQAIEVFKRATAQGVTFDVILLDLQMPNLNGYETATELRKLGYANPIIALTADAMQGDMTRCIEAGCNYHISKPINKAELLRLIFELAPRTSSP